MAAGRRAGTISLHTFKYLDGHYNLTYHGCIPKERLKRCHLVSPKFGDSKKIMRQTVTFVQCRHQVLTRKVKVK